MENKALLRFNFCKILFSHFEPFRVVYTALCLCGVIVHRLVRPNTDRRRRNGPLCASSASEEFRWVIICCQCFRTKGVDTVNARRDALDLGAVLPCDCLFPR